MSRHLILSAGPDIARAAEDRSTGLAAAVAVSLLLHGALLLAWRHAPQPDRPLPGRPPPLTVRLQAPPPPLAAAPPEAAQQTAQRPAKPHKPPARTANAAPRPAEPSPPTQAPMTVPAPPSAPSTDYRPANEPAAPKFDMEAARRTARAVANAPDPAKADTAVGQFPEKPLRTETRLARDIAQAKRGDCKDGVPGGLLAPVYMLMEKKDHGCKW